MSVWWHRLFCRHRFHVRWDRYWLGVTLTRWTCYDALKEGEQE